VVFDHFKIDILLLNKNKVEDNCLNYVPQP
jgi:hypothetical protein